MNKMGGMCLNWKVIAALSALGLGVWVIAPSFVGLALPLLIVLVCPLSMLFMMRGMGGSQCAAQSSHVRQPAATALTREEQLAEMKSQLASLKAEQDTITREIGEMNAATGKTVPLGEHGRRMAPQLYDRS